MDNTLSRIIQISKALNNLFEGIDYELLFQVSHTIMNFITLISKLLILFHDSFWIIYNLFQVITVLIFHNINEVATFKPKKVYNFYNIFMVEAVQQLSFVNNLLGIFRILHFLRIYDFHCVFLCSTQTFNFLDLTLRTFA